MTDASDTTLIIDDYAHVTPIIQFASEASAQCRPSLNGHIERRRTNTHAGELRRRACGVLYDLSSMNVGCLFTRYCLTSSFFLNQSSRHASS